MLITCHPVDAVNAYHEVEVVKCICAIDAITLVIRVRIRYKIRISNGIVKARNNTTQNPFWH